MDAEEYDGDTWEILGEMNENNPCTCPPNKPAREKRHASVKFGPLVKDKLHGALRHIQMSLLNCGREMRERERERRRRNEKERERKREREKER